MPGPLIHAGTIVTCSHGGVATPTIVSPKVFVDGQPIVTQPSPYVIAGCTLPPPPGANGPCVTAAFVTAAARVQSFGQPVLLADSVAVCAPTGTPLIALPASPRVTGI